MEFVNKKIKVKCRTCKKERFFNMKVAEEEKGTSPSRVSPSKKANIEWRCECGLIQDTQYKY